MKLSIVVPVFNEGKTVKFVLQKLLSLKLPLTYEVIVIDDGSTDGTTQILKQYPIKDKKKLKREKQSKPVSRQPAETIFWSRMLIWSTIRMK